MFNYVADFPNHRGRRLRNNFWIRDLVAENNISVNDLIWPIFLIEGKDKIEPINELPGVNRYTVDKLIEIASNAFELGIKCVALFPYTPSKLKSENCEEAYNPDNLVNKATRLLKKELPDLGIMLDVALDPYNSLGHDGLVKENKILNDYYQKPFSSNYIMSWGDVERVSETVVKNFDIRTPSITTLTQNLSGGNQQKLVVGRELSNNVDFLIASQPTRGIDVGSIEYIHKQLIKTRNNGKGILLISTELDEILTLSDRILVLFEGKIIKEFSSNASTEEIGLAMAGQS